MAAVAQPPASLPSGPSSVAPSSKGSRASRSKKVQVKAEEPKAVRSGSEDAGEDNKDDKDKDDAKSPSGPGNRESSTAEERTRSNTRFDLEPNPFEQSFSRGSQSQSERTTPPRGGDATSIKPNALPPLSSLTSPAAADPTQFPWLAGQSLRSGPLSPAMLAGPQNNNQPQGGNAAPATEAPVWGSTTENDAAANDENFEPGNFRTGFTPGTGSGFTPGYNALLNSNFGALPMPSPNTAAFLNSITNVNENVDPAAGGERPAPSAIPPHLQPHGMSHLNPAHGGPQDTVQPNTLNPLVPDPRQQGGPPGPIPAGAYYPPGMHPGGPPAGPLPPGMAPVDYAQQNANAASQAANGLFLLSQAHQELSKREEEAKSSSPAAGKRGGSSAPKSAGQKRKEPAPKGNAAKRNKKMSETSDDDDDLSDTGSRKGDKKNRNETEEEKRKNFLERNRQAALKCRQRKKAWLNELQNKVETLSMDNERLQHNVRGLEEEIARLTSILMQHRECGLAMPPVAYGRPLR